MTGFQIVVVLVCAGLGFGIVNSLINAARKPDGAEDDEPDNSDPH